MTEWIYVLAEDRKFYVDVREGVSDEMDINIHSFDLVNNNIELIITFIDNDSN